MSDEIKRLTKIAARVARRCGAKSASYASARNFTVYMEKWRMNRITGENEYLGLVKLNHDMRDVYARPAKVARAIKAEIKQAWA